MTSQQPESDGRTGDEQFNALHPILNNYELPVEIEGIPRPSGPQNLSRLGWNEKRECIRPTPLVQVLNHLSVP